MKDKYGYKKPIQIESNEYWFNGCFIQDQRGYPCDGLPNYVIFADGIGLYPYTHTAWSFKEAKQAAMEIGAKFDTPNRPERFLY